MISEIHIQGFKSIQDQAIHFGQRNILIGDHNSGKSNLISFFRLMYAIFNRNLQNFARIEGEDFLFFKGHKASPEIKGRIVWDKNVHTLIYTFNLSFNTSHNMVFTHECISAFSKGIEVKKVEFNDSDGWRESLVSKLKNVEFLSFIEHLKEIQTYHFSHVKDVLIKSKTADIEDNFELRYDGRNLASLLYLLKEEHQQIYSRIIKIIQEALPEFKTFILKPHVLNQEEIALKWMMVNDTNIYPINLLSDSTVRFIALITGLMQVNPPKILLIDEPELGLSHNVLNLLCKIIQELTDVTQILLATQSEDFSLFSQESFKIKVTKEENKSNYKTFT